MEHFVLMSIFTPENTVGKKNDPDKDLVQTRTAEYQKMKCWSCLSSLQLVLDSFNMYYKLQKKETSIQGYEGYAPTTTVNSKTVVHGSYHDYIISILASWEDTMLV